jgi:hypothetical protein
MLTSLKIHLDRFIPSKTATRHFLSIFLVAFFLTTLYTWPLINKLAVLYNDVSDYSLVGWILWYNQLSFTSGRIFSSIDYFNAFQFYPWGYSLAFSENLFFPALIFAPIYWLTNQLVLSVNTYTFLTFIITFVISFYVFKKFLNAFFPSIIAATVFTFNPLTSAHFPGHTHLLGKFFLPLIFLWGLYFFSKPTIKNAFFLGLFFTLNALSSINFFIISVPFMVLLSLPYLIVNIYQKNFIYFKNLCLSGLTLIVFLPILMFFLLPYQQFSQKEGAIRTIDESIFYSAQPIDWFSPFPASKLYGSFVYSYANLRVGYPQVNYSEHTLALNIIPICLFILGAIYLKKKIFAKNPLALYSIIIILVGTMLFTFGPKWEDIFLPYYYFNNITHLFEGIRVPTRFQFFFYLPFALIVGYGFIKIKQLIKINYLLLTIFVLALIMVENLTAWDMDDVSFLTTNPPIIQEYRNLNFLQDKTVLHIPTYAESFEKQITYLNLATIHRERLMNGYSGFFPSEWTRLLQSIEQNPDKQTLEKLHALKMDYLIFHKSELTEKYISELKQNNPDIQHLTTFENSNFLIVEVNNPVLKKPHCILNKDINLELIPLSANYELEPIYFNQIKIINKGDCYLVNTLQHRYLKSSFFINGKYYQTEIKMPVVITPKEEILLK